MKTKRKQPSAFRAPKRISDPADKEMIAFVERFKREADRERRLLINNYRRGLAPHTPDEIAAVDEMATAFWGLRLLQRHEHILIEEKANELSNDFPEADDFTLLFKALDVLHAGGGEFKLIQEKNASYTHQYMHASNRLGLLRAKTENLRTN
jgi:hypothetical protein